VINSGGIKLHPEEIERKLAIHIKSRFFVAGIPDEKLGEKLVLIIEGNENPAISNEVRNLKTLSKFEAPKETFFVEKFIETETGKIQRIQTLQKIGF
jgi:O-succinylbenzoic acid--CoA ligase